MEKKNPKQYYQPLASSAPRSVRGAPNKVMYGSKK